MPVAQLHRHALHYDTAGESGPPVLLVMGYGMPGTAWQHQVPALCQHHRVAWYDNAGVGKSEPPYTRRLTMADLAEDAVGMLDHLGWDDAHVIGVSMGGMVAQHVALRHRPRVRSLTLIATHAGGSVRHKIPTITGLRRFLRVNTSKGRRRIEALCKLLYPPEYLADHMDEAIDTLGHDFSIPPSKEARLGQLHAILGHDTERSLARLDGLPTLVVRPDRDLLIRPEQSNRLARAIPGARMVNYPDAGHGLIRQKRDRLNEDLLQHLATA